MPEFRDTIAFHCQQAVEKYVKAFLVFCDTQFPKTHNLILLLDLISRTVDISTDLYERVNLLQSFSVDIRYPETTTDLTDDDIRTALRISKDFRFYILSLMGLEVTYREIADDKY